MEEKKRSIDEYIQLLEEAVQEDIKRCDEIERKYGVQGLDVDTNGEYAASHKIAKEKIDQLRKGFFADYPEGLPDQYQKKKDG